MNERSDEPIGWRQVEKVGQVIGNCSRDRVAILMSNWNCIKMVTERDLEGVDLVFASFSQYCNEKTKEISSARCIPLWPQTFLGLTQEDDQPQW